MKLLVLLFAFLLSLSCPARVLECQKFSYQGQDYVYCPQSQNFYRVVGFEPDIEPVCVDVYRALDLKNHKTIEDMRDKLEAYLRNPEM